MRNRVGEETEDETRPKRIDNERDRSIDQSTRDHRLPLSKRASLEKLGLLFTRILGGFSACLPISTIVYTRRGAAIDTIQENGNNIASILSRRRVSLSLSLSSLSLLLARNYYCRSIVLAKIRTSSANLPAHFEISSSCSDVRSRRYSATFPCFFVSLFGRSSASPLRFLTIKPTMFEMPINSHSLHKFTPRTASFSLPFSFFCFVIILARNCVPRREPKYLGRKLSSDFQTLVESLTLNSSETLSSRNISRFLEISRSFRSFVSKWKLLVSTQRARSVWKQSEHSFQNTRGILQNLFLRDFAITKW